MAFLVGLLFAYVLYEQAKESDEAKKITIISILITSVYFAAIQQFDIYSVLVLSTVVNAFISICYDKMK